MSEIVRTADGMAELIPLPRPLPPQPLLEVPPEVVRAIALAAVEAYKEQERMKRRAYQRAYYRINRDRIQKRKRQRRAL